MKTYSVVYLQAEETGNLKTFMRLTDGVHNECTIPVVTQQTIKLWAIILALKNIDCQRIRLYIPIMLLFNITKMLSFSCHLVCIIEYIIIVSQCTPTPRKGDVQLNDKPNAYLLCVYLF